MDPYVSQIALLAGAEPPPDWIPCDGGILPIDRHQVLYALIGARYGGDARGTFAVPDLRGRLSRAPGAAENAAASGTDKPDFFIAEGGVFPSRGDEPVQVDHMGILTGQIAIFPLHWNPAGFISCDGRVLPIASHTALFSLLGTRFGGDGQASFALPDLSLGATMTREVPDGDPLPPEVHFLIDLEDPLLRIVLFGGTFVPAGWTPCDGRVLPIDAHPGAFRRIGDRYGGDGFTDFAVPDLRERVVRTDHPGAPNGEPVYGYIAPNGIYPQRS